MTPSVERAPFPVHLDGRQADLFTLRNRRGVEVRLTSYGGVILSIRVPDRDGVVDDIVPGFASAGDYLDNAPYFGAVIGRYANRIAGGRFSIDGRTFVLERNDGPNHLHGGPHGFHQVVWHAASFRAVGVAGVRLAYDSPDGEGGYPGALRASVAYTLTAEDELIFDYHAVTDRATHVNLTQHTYFNLAGHGAGSVLDHVVTVHADAFTPVDATLVPTGEVRATAGTPFDLRETRIGARIDDDDAQLQLAGGFDHNFVLRPVSDGALRPAARVSEPVHGRVLEVHTTEPGLQLYTGNQLHDVRGKNGVRYGPRAGLALETQHFPDSPNHPHFPSTLLRLGSEYRSRTLLRFGVA